MAHLIISIWGVNLPYLYILDTLKKEYDINEFVITKNVFFIDEIGDKSNIDNVSLTSKQWDREYSESSAYKLYDKEDPYPYYWAYTMNHWLITTPKRVVKKILLNFKTL